MIKKVKDFLGFSEHNKEYKRIKKHCDLHYPDNYKINNDLSVDVYMSIFLENESLTEIPFKFNIVKGNFDCSHNELKNLKNCPNEIYGDFTFSVNNIDSLEYFPSVVTGNVNGFFNKITDISKLDNMNIKFVDMERNYLTNITVDQSKRTRTNRCPIDYLIGIIAGKHCLDIKIVGNVKNRLEIVERLDEFEVIKNGNEIDMISLNTLFDYYGKKFLKDYIIERISSIKLSDDPTHRPEDNIQAYKIINS